jgi:pimeloyl-ACP methyl ester carboxylesterase
MLTAALAFDPTSRGQRRLGVIGYSMGASLAAAMARVAHTHFDRKVALESVVLVEPVANRCWSGSQLLAAMRAEDKLIDGYLKTNEDIPGAVMPTNRIPGAPSPRARRVDLLWAYAPGPLSEAAPPESDDDFAYDPSLGDGGGYMFRMKSNGMSTGTYVLIFEASGDPLTHAAQFQIP